MAQYKTGSVTVENGSNVITGNGTVWLTNATVGDWFKVDDRSAIYQIAVINSNTEIELTVNYAEADGSGLSYCIVRDFAPIYDTPLIFKGDIDWPDIYRRAINNLEEVINGIEPDTNIISGHMTILNPSTGNFIAWRAPFACTVTAVYGYRVGGTGTTINARKNGSYNHLASALSLTSTDTWMSGGTVQNAAYAIGEKLEIMIVSVSGSPTQVAVQIDFTKP
jgi:hypothetical protein